MPNENEASIDAAKTHQFSWALHSSDQPGMILVSTPLDSTNYLPWSTAMKIALGSKEKMGLVDGSLKMPEDDEGSKLWKKADQMIMSWLLNSIAKNMRESFLYFPSSHAIWSELERRFGVTSGPRLLQIQREMMSIKQGNDSVTVYYGRLHK